MQKQQSVALTEKVTELSNTVAELQASNSTKDALIAGYKASSKPAPNQSKEAPKTKETLENKGLSEKIKNTQTIKLK